VIVVTAAHDSSSRRDGSFDVPVQRVESIAPDFEAIYVRHYADVSRYILALTRSRDETEEVVAETFARAFRAWSPATPPDRPLPWLLLTARRIATDRWRRARRRVLDLAGHSSRDEFERTEFWLWFDQLAVVLSARQREVLLLRYKRDLSDEEIGRVMGLTGAGVRSLVARALAVLRAHPDLLA
jgi:RNA polymerase sigma factor (sigma-70 family)